MIPAQSMQQLQHLRQSFLPSKMALRLTAQNIEELRDTIKQGCQVFAAGCAEPKHRQAADVRKGTGHLSWLQQTA